MAWTAPSTWVAGATLTAAQLNAQLRDNLLAVTPAGSLVAYAGAAAPSGWLMCDGAAISRTTYASLFAVTSTTYGVGNGSTTFNLPDMRGRSPIGSGTGVGLTARALNAQVGTETHQIITSEMPSHAHTATTGNDTPDHGHHPALHYGNFLLDYAAVGGFASGGNAQGDAGRTGTTTGGATQQHTHAVTVSPAGGGGAHNNMPPVLGVNFIIKT